MNQRKPRGLGEIEWHALRLFRCFDHGDQSDILTGICKRLVLKHLDEDDGNEDWNEDDAYCEALLRLLPKRWPGQKVVRLRNLGDYSKEFYSELDDLMLVWFFEEGHDSSTAHSLTRIYRTATGQTTRYTTQPGDDVLTVVRVQLEAEEADESFVGMRQEFECFIKEWRERITLALEEACY